MLFLAGLLLVWEVCCIVFQVPEIILPTRTKIFAVFVQRFDILMAYCWDTLWTTTVGFLLAIAFGLLLGLAIGASPFVFPASIAADRVQRDPQGGDRADPDDLGRRRLAPAVITPS